ncbi:cytochrome P450 [Arthrobacter sp. ISL-28]|uniref:cytochrome P450 n=1 Tax=Arthrobacter sp. ISL-28 TaxID=2819108 RepID=UPI001BEB2E15|nr:cytochrome P450 [Arthrobacter sp. ISL-28]MBT2523484.1 cytochrome P450 [Arthrobacter sp. ISL-28]
MSIAAPVHSPSLPVSDEDPFSEEILNDPLPFQERLRDAGAVVLLEKYGTYAMGRYDTVEFALRNWPEFQSGAGVGLSNFRFEKPWRPPSLLLEADPPHHNAPRAALAKILSPRSLNRLAPAWRDDADKLIDKVISSGLEFDGVEALSEQFPLRVFPDAVGLRQDGRDLLLPYGDHLFNAFGPENFLTAKGAPRAGELSAAVNAMCARDQLAETGLGADVWAAADRGDITEAQAPLIVRSLLSAGIDTTVHGVGSVLYYFATNPEQWEAVKADPGLVRTAFDEAVRLESPVQTFFRTATTDVVVDGVTIPDGQKILMFLGSANHDPRRWENPDAFDLTRDPSGHVGFGMGVHQCIGQHVARLEAATLLLAMIERIDTIELTDAPSRHLNNTLRAWETLPLRITLK